MEQQKHVWGLPSESARLREIYRFESYELEPSVYELRSTAGATIALGTKSLSVLVYLMRQCHRAVSREELLAEIWPGVSVGNGSLTQAIWEIRAALGQRSGKSQIIQTLRGRGYRFTARVERQLLDAGGASIAEAAVLGPVGPAELAAVDCSNIETHDFASMLERTSGKAWPTALRSRVRALSKDAMLTVLELASLLREDVAAPVIDLHNERTRVDRSA
jgi:DNA-binding winged helix-turn-helix (wHTH) protein